MRKAWKWRQWGTLVLVGCQRWMLRPSKPVRTAAHTPASGHQIDSIKGNQGARGVTHIFTENDRKVEIGQIDV